MRLERPSADRSRRTSRQRRLLRRARSPNRLFVSPGSDPRLSLSASWQVPVRRGIRAHLLAGHPVEPPVLLDQLAQRNSQDVRDREQMANIRIRDTALIEPLDRLLRDPCARRERPLRHTPLCAPVRKTGVTPSLDLVAAKHRHATLQAEHTLPGRSQQGTEGSGVS